MTVDPHSSCDLRSCDSNRTCASVFMVQELFEAFCDADALVRTTLNRNSSTRAFH